MEDQNCSQLYQIEKQLEEMREFKAGWNQYREEMRPFKEYTKSQFHEVSSQLDEISSKLDTIIELLPDWMRRQGIEPPDLVGAPLNCSASAIVLGNPVDEMLGINKALDSDENGVDESAIKHSFVDDEASNVLNGGTKPIHTTSGEFSLSIQAGIRLVDETYLSGSLKLRSVGVIEVWGIYLGELTSQPSIEKNEGNHGNEIDGEFAQALSVMALGDKHCLIASNHFHIFSGGRHAIFALIVDSIAHGDDFTKMDLKSLFEEANSELLMKTLSFDPGGFSLPQMGCYLFELNGEQGVCCFTTDVDDASIRFDEYYNDAFSGESASLFSKFVPILELVMSIQIGFIVKAYIMLIHTGMALWYWSGNYLKIMVVGDHCVTPNNSAIMFLLEISLSGIPMVGLVTWQTNEVEYLRKSLETIEGVCERICLSRYQMIVFDPGGCRKLAWLWIERVISLLYDLSHVEYLVMCLGSHILKYIGRTSSVDEMKRGVHFAAAIAVMISSSDSKSGQHSSATHQIQQAYNIVVETSSNVGAETTFSFTMVTVLYLTTGTNDYIHFYQHNVSTMQFSRGTWSFNQSLAQTMKQKFKDLYIADVRRIVAMGFSHINGALYYSLWQYCGQNWECIDVINGIILEINVALRYRADGL